MNSLNKAQVIGNVTRNPELKTTTGGQTVCTVGVATNRYWKDASGEKKDEVEFHNIVVWGKLAEICTQYLKQGTKVFFDGRLQTRNWEDESGVKHYRTEIVAQDMIILTPKGDGPAEPFIPQSKPVTSAPSNANKADEVDTEDLPF
jgi:single-strand DNA-binding protein